MMLKLNMDRLFSGRIPTRAELCKGERVFFFFLSGTVIFEHARIQNIKQKKKFK